MFELPSSPAMAKSPSVPAVTLKPGRNGRRRNSAWRGCVMAIARLMHLARLRQPLIAALNGHTLGGGLELAVTADFRIADEHVKLGSPETGLGIIPGWSGTQRAVRRFGSQTVRRMALAGEIFTAEQGLALGLVDQVVPKGQSLAAARTLAERIAARGPAATQATKMLVNAIEGEDADRALEALAGIAAASSADLREGVAAFREKRRPKF